jgi:hypothetical protein
VDEQNIVAAILTASLSNKGAYDNAEAAVRTYFRVLAELEKQAPPSPPRSGGSSLLSRQL